MSSLANKYRPQTFKEVVSQDYIKQVLENQIESGNISNGYLFTGGAGTGKTTTARILAKSINSEIIEIDGASNNGVESIREIRDSIKFKPIGKEYKVYIIDEAHMLSNGAWNALLKILEEPPKHGVFLFCTTDSHKIPATILSRVQRFDFKRLTTQQVYEMLSIISLNERKDITDEALMYIAHMANGGMRAGISLLDTVLSYKKDGITELDVLDVLGVPSVKDYIEMTTLVLNKQHDKVILLVERLHEEGKCLSTFLKAYMEFIIEVRKVHILGSLTYVNIPYVYKEDIDKLKVYDLNKYFLFLNRVNQDYKHYKELKTLLIGELISYE